MACRKPLVLAGTGTPSRRTCSADGAHLGPGVAGGLLGSIVEELAQGLAKVAGDAGHDRRQLDRERDVVDEVDQHAKVDQRQGERGGDREVRHKLCRAQVSDRGQGEHGVGEGRNERAEARLRAEVADEVAQHARPELLRGQLQREDRDRKDDTGDRDDRGGDADQDLAGGVGAARGDPAGQCEPAFVGRSIQQVGECEQDDRHTDHEDRDEPQVRAQRLAAPAAQGSAQAAPLCEVRLLCHARQHLLPRMPIQGADQPSRRAKCEASVPALVVFKQSVQYLAYA